jgi:N4-gp56 family major capsid protein
MASDFATNPTTMTTYDDVSYSAILSDEVKDALMAVVVTPALLDFHDLSGEASKAVKISKADKFTAAAVSEGTELANTPLTTTSVTLTTSEIGIMATVTDVLEVSDIPAAHGARLKQLGRSLGDKIDIDVCALFAGFSTAVGATGVNIALTDILDAIYNLEVNDAAGLGSIVGALHPRQTADFRTEFEADTAAIYSGAGTGKIGKASAGYFGSWFGVDIFQSTNVPTANAAADRAGAFFIRDYALGLAQKWSAKVEVMRWPPIRGFVIVATAMYGVGEIEDSAGVAATTDA